MSDAPTDAAPPVEKAPEAAAPAEGAPAEGGEPGPSKKALKKAEAKAKKEAEKARRAAEHKANQEAAKKAAGNAEDLAKDNYGDDHHTIKVDAERVALRAVGEEHLGKTIKLRAWIQNARMQGAKMAFVELREERNWAIQAVVAASPEGTPVSKQMVKWIGALRLESYVLVEATVEKPLEPVKSVRVSDYELHIKKCYCIAAGPEVLGMGLAVANKAVTNLDDEDTSDAKDITEGVENLAVDNVPGASMATHLNNPVMHKRAPVQQAISDVRMTVRKLFSEYLEARNFVQFEAPCLINAASEGGSNVFGLPYFEKQAYLAQSPQFYKQIEIAGGRKRVFCIGPVFRAENSNTPRHMTEVCTVSFQTSQTTRQNKTWLICSSSPVSISRWKSRTTTTRLCTCWRVFWCTSSGVSRSDARNRLLSSAPSIPQRSSSSPNPARKSA